MGQADKVVLVEGIKARVVYLIRARRNRALEELLLFYCNPPEDLRVGGRHPVSANDRLVRVLRVARSDRCWDGIEHLTEGRRTGWKACESAACQSQTRRNLANREYSSVDWELQRVSREKRLRVRVGSSNQLRGWNQIDDAGTAAYTHPFGAVEKEKLVL